MADPEVADAGETTDIAGELAEMIVNPDDGEEEQEPEQKEPEKKAEPEPEPDKPDYEKRFGELANQLEDLKKENNRLGYALRKAEKDKTPTKEEAQFTDAQLLQMMKEHQDEPEVVFNIIKQMQYQSGKAIEQSAEQKAEMQSKRRELLDVTNKILPGAIDEGSAIYGEIESTRDYLGLQGNPFGDVLSLALMSLKNLPNLIENVKEQTKKELLGKTSDNKRKDTIKETKPTDTGSKAESVKQPNIDETAKRLGLNDRQMKRYQEILKKSKGGAIQASI